MHDQAVSYKCELCDERFHKTHQLREHTALAHMPAGTKPFICLEEGCGASFAMKAHLKTHVKTHDGMPPSSMYESVLKISVEIYLFSPFTR